MPVEAAQLEVVRWDGAAGAASVLPWRPGDPSVRLSPGTYSLAATVERLRSDSRRVVVSPDRPTPSVTLTLRPPPRGSLTVIGTVAADDPWSAPRVYLSRLDEGVTPDDSELLGSRLSGILPNRVPGGFQQTFKDLAPGNYLVGVGRRPGEVAARGTVTVTDGESEMTLAMPPVSRGDYRVVHVLDPGGVPLDGAQVSSGYIGLSGFSWNGSAGIRRPDGSFWVLPQLPFGRRGGASVIAVTADGYGARLIPVGPDDEVSVRFEPPSSLTVFVDGIVDSGHEESVQVAILPIISGIPEGPRPFLGPTAKKPDARGAATFGDLQPGDFEISIQVHSPEDSLRGATVERRVVSLASGKNEVRMSLPGLSSLTVTVDPLPADGALHAWPARFPLVDDTVATVAVDEKGIARLRHLPAGRYVLRRAREGEIFEEMLVAIPGEDQVAFRPGRLDAVRVVSADGGRALAAAGFHAGDVLVEVDRAAFGSIAELVRLLDEAFAKGDACPVTVLRGGARETLRLPRQALGSPAAAGGILELGSR